MTNVLSSAHLTNTAWRLTRNLANSLKPLSKHRIAGEPAETNAGGNGLGEGVHANYAALDVNAMM